MPHLVQMHEKHKKDGLEVVTVNFFFGDDDMPKDKYLAQTRELLKDKKATTLNLYLEDAEKVLDKNLHIFAAPSVYVFDRQGRWTAFGGVNIEGAGDADHAKIEQLVEKLLKEAPAK